MDHRLDTWGAIYQFQTNTNSQKASTNHWWSYQQSGFNPKHWYHLKQWVCPQMYAKCIGSWNQQPQEQYWVPSLFPQTSQSIHPVISFKPSTSRWLFSYNQGTLIPQTLPWFQPAALWFAGGGGGRNLDLKHEAIQAYKWHRAVRGVVFPIKIYLLAESAEELTTRWQRKQRIFGWLGIPSWPQESLRLVSVNRFCDILGIGRLTGFLIPETDWGFKACHKWVETCPCSSELVDQRGCDWKKGWSANSLGIRYSWLWPSVCSIMMWKHWDDLFGGLWKQSKERFILFSFQVIVYPVL